SHYSDDRFDSDRQELLSGMTAKGVGRIVEVGAGIATTKDALALAHQYDFIYAAAGIHPEEADDLEESHMDWLRELTQDDRVVAVGEIGLDYHYDSPSREIQRRWFVRQLQIASETGMPVIIHSRDAAQDTWDVMQEYCDWKNGGVIHCFSYGREVARQYLEQGFFLGIGGVVTFDNARKLKEVVQMAPLEQLVLETDCPYLTPAPHRGKRNDSGYLTHVVDVVADLKGISRDEVIAVTEHNAERLYRLE
ncbi:MAG: TatD family hydrolase, partial [Lachnospiraceae bacterium]|nr:TatD family hydrolase [Lachnospiraceae bacterium]